MFTQLFNQSADQETIKAPLHWTLCGEFPAQKASNTENISIWWRHHGVLYLPLLLRVTITCYNKSTGIAPPTYLQFCVGYKVTNRSRGGMAFYRHTYRGTRLCQAVSWRKIPKLNSTWQLIKCDGICAQWLVTVCQATRLWVSEDDIRSDSEQGKMRDNHEVTFFTHTHKHIHIRIWSLRQITTNCWAAALSINYFDQWIFLAMTNSTQHSDWQKINFRIL